MFRMKQRQSLDSILLGDAKLLIDDAKHLLKKPGTRDRLETVVKVSALIYIGAKILSSFSDYD